MAAGIAGEHVAVTVSTDQVDRLGRFVDNDCVAIILTGNPQLPQNVVLPGIGTLGVPWSLSLIRPHRPCGFGHQRYRDAGGFRHGDTANLGATLFSHDATGSDEKHNNRLIAVARGSG
ncbi:MAG: hypothetical protein R3C99_07295 [Pirellulaceae bacterium]